VKISKSSLIVLIAVVIVAAIFYVLTLEKPNTNELTYNGFYFAKVNDLWQTEWQRDNQDYILDFRFNPEEVKDIPIEGTVDMRAQLETVYLTIDPSEEKTVENANLNIAAIELATKLTAVFERTVLTACTRNESSGCLERPIVTCANTNQTVFYLKQDNESKIVLDGNCITIQGTNQGIVKASNKIIFKWLGIID
jgi:hypothetical protein